MTYLDPPSSVRSLEQRLRNLESDDGLVLRVTVTDRHGQTVEANPAMVRVRPAPPVIAYGPRADVLLVSDGKAVELWWLPALAPDGILMLGAAETVIGQTDKFEASREFRGFYQRTGAAIPGQHRIAV